MRMRAVIAATLLLPSCVCQGAYKVDENGEVRDDVEIQVQSEGFLWDEWDLEVLGEFETGGSDWITLLLYMGPCEMPQVTLSRLSGHPPDFETMTYIRKGSCAALYDEWTPLGDLASDGSIDYEQDGETLTLHFRDVRLYWDEPGTDGPSFTSIRMNGEYVARLRDACGAR